MRADFHEDDPKALWQNQQTESSTVSSVLIRQKARELRTRRRRQLIGTVVVPVIVSFFYAFCVEQFPHVQATAHCLYVLSLAWSGVGIYVLNRGISPGDIPEDTGFRTGLEFCRHEVQRQLRYVRRVLLWSFGPILVALGTFVLVVATKTSDFPKAIPFLTLAGVWIAAYLFIRARQQRALKRELDELNSIEWRGGQVFTGTPSSQ